MKIFGKSNNGYTVHLTKEEMDIIVFGYTSPKHSEAHLSNYKEVSQKLETGFCEVEICGRFKRIIQIASNSEFRDNDEYASIIKKMKTAIANLKPYEKLITEITEIVDAK